jgi:two-component system, NarL family, nitrate/nitrite response regulator NarL
LRISKGDSGVRFAEVFDFDDSGSISRNREMRHDSNRDGDAIRVLVADNSPFHTQLLANTLKGDPGFYVFSSDLSAISLTAAARNQKIDVFVLSVFAEGDNQCGLKILQYLREKNPEVRVILLLNSADPEAILEAFRSGAKGVFHIQEPSDVLCRCIRRVYEGEAWVSREQMTLLLEALAATPKIKAVDRKGMNLLSKRESEVVRYLAEGLTNREIAKRIGLSQHTVKNYLFRIFDKLGVSNRMELLSMTLSQSSAAGSSQVFPKNPAEGYDDATFASCQKAAEGGAVAAQLALAHMLSSGRKHHRDIVRAYMWFSVAADHVTNARNKLKKTMSPAELAVAQVELRDWLEKSGEARSSGESKKSAAFETAQEIPDPARAN